MEISINGAAVDAIVDLGYPGEIMTTLDPVTLCVDPHYNSPRVEVAVAGYKGEGLMSVAREVGIGQSKLADVSILCFSATGAPPLAILGVDFMKRFDLTFDFQHQELILRPVSI